MGAEQTQCSNHGMVDMLIKQLLGQIGDLEERVRDLELDKSGAEEKFKQLFNQLKELRTSIDKIADGLDKFKWWLISSVVAPVILQLILNNLTK